jgi:type VI secretion system secreted protein VgrG
MSKRLLELEPTGLFGDEAILTTLDGHEEISKPFDFLLAIASTKTTLKPEDVIGKPLAVRINRDDKDPRYIHGYVSSFWAGNSVAHATGGTKFRMYRVRLVPWVWFMSQASRCFVYLPEKKEKTIQDVLDEVIKRVTSYGHVVPTIESGNAKILTQRKVEHCVQYRETDLNFMSRTLERYGVRYYYKYTNSSHTVILSDQINYPNIPEAEVSFPLTTDDHAGEDIITSWEHSYEFITGKWEHTDYDFINPSTSLKSNSQNHSAITLKNNEGYERYDYPGDFVKKDDGKAEAEIRLEAEESQFNTVQGTSNCKTFSPGYCFKLADHPTCKDEKGKAYLITTVYHSAAQPGPYTGSDEPARYSNSFTCITRDIQYRPQQHARQPILSSVQTAMVVGPGGEEIYTDEYGRVKVQFHWDREGKRDENTSCWVRVSQVHAGRGFGGIDIPRIGEEVVVSFLEGDPDRPLITGRVYHKEAMPPFALPASKTISGFKTKTYKGKGYNEMSMDDTGGKELINIHAQYDMTTTVQHDQTDTINNNRTAIIAVDDKETIGSNQEISVGADQKTTIGSNQNVTVGSNCDETIGSNFKQAVGSNSTTDIGASGELKTGANYKSTAGANSEHSAGANYKITAGAQCEVSAAMIKLSAGGSTIEIGPAGVTITGAMIKISAAAITDIKGAMVKINS